MKDSPKIDTRETICRGGWLSLNKIFYTDTKGKKRDWESVERLRHHGAAVMIPILKPSGRVILIRQYRPPAGTFMIEFPAGLIDDGEAPEQTAERELMEETGYAGKINVIHDRSFNSPGMSGESVNLAVMEIDENLPENKSTIQNLDDGEDIEIFPVPVSSLGTFLEQRREAGDMLDSKVLAFSIGMNFGVRA